jgi:hypothetical protein
MRRLIVLAAALFLAGQASAKTLDWYGTLDAEMWKGAGFTLYGSGVATVNGSSGGAHLSTLRLAGGITGSGIVPVTDPEVTPQVKSIIGDMRLGTGTWTGISGGPPLGQDQLPVGGFMRVCLFLEGCGANLPFALTLNDGNTGVGVGGLITLGGKGSVRISLEAMPWTIGNASVVNQTMEGNFRTNVRAGFVHGGASATDSSTAVTSGVVQLIAPMLTTNAGVTGNSNPGANFTTLTLRFVPEPGLLVMIASGVVGLGLVVRSRMEMKR